MLPEAIDLDIVTPEKRLVSLAVDEVVLPGSEGSMGVLPGHAPLLTALDVGELTRQSLQLRERIAHRLIMRCAAGAQLFVAIVEMLRQLLDDLQPPGTVDRQTRELIVDCAFPVEDHEVSDLRVPAALRVPIAPYVLSRPAIRLIACANSFHVSRCDASTLAPAGVSL